MAYALAGTVDIDLIDEPSAPAQDGEPVYLRDIWPTQQEVDDADRRAQSTPEMFRKQYANVCDRQRAVERDPGQRRRAVRLGCEQHLHPGAAVLHRPEATSPRPIQPIKAARVLVMVGDSVTTDHISPGRARSRRIRRPASTCMEHGVQPVDFNSYGSRRGNDRVMTRGTFANIRLRNLLAPGTEGGVTTLPARPAK